VQHKQKMIIDKDKLFPELESIGEQAVRVKLAQGVYNKDKEKLIHEWLRSLESSRTEETSVRQEERELEANELAKEANLIARSASATAIEALRIARQERITAIIAAIAAIIATITGIIFNIYPPSKW
jgi:hypothetical protein